MKIINKINSPPGRFDVIPKGKDSFIVVDFAHTPGAVEQIINSVRNSFPESKL